MKSLLTKLGIKKNEKDTAIICIQYSLLIGFSQVWLQTIPMVLFLKYYSAEQLPYVYILSSILLVISGVLYSFFEKKFKFTQLFAGILKILAINFLLLWSLAIFFSEPWIYFLIIICATTSFDLLELTLWTPLNQLLTLDQVKRLTGFIGVFQTSASIIGNLSIPLLILFVSATNVLLLISIITFCSLLCLNRIFIKYNNRFKSIKTDDETTGNSTHKVKPPKDTYLVNNIIFASLTVFAFTFIELLFYLESDKRFPDSVQLASFLGLFNAAISFFDLMIRGFVSTLIIKKYGVKIALLIKSFIGILLIAVIILLLKANASIYPLFIICALIKFFDEGLLYSMIRQVGFILYQPLVPNIRTWLQTKIELITQPVVTIVASLIFLGVNYYYADNVTFLWIILLIISLATLFNIFSLYKGYIVNLTKAIEQRRISVDKQKYLDKKYSSYLFNKLKNGSADEAIYCLKILRKIDIDQWEEGLNICLSHSSEFVKYVVLKKLQFYRSPQFVKSIRAILNQETDKTLLSAGFKALFHQNRKAFKDQIELSFKKNKPILLDEVIIISLNAINNIMLLNLARTMLIELVNSNEADLRSRAASIIGQLNSQEFLSQFISLLQDKDINVVRTALLSSSLVNEKLIYNLLLQSLTNKLLKQSAIKALVKKGDDILEFLETSLTAAFYQENEQSVFDLISIIAKIKTPAAQQLLIKILSYVKIRKFRHYIVSALDLLNYKPITLKEHNEVNKHLLGEIHYVKQLQTYAISLLDNERYETLATTLRREIETCIHQIFIHLSFIYSTNDIKNIARNLNNSDIDKSSYSTELLDNILHKDHKDILSLLAYNDMSKTARPNGPMDAIKKLVSSAPMEVSSILKATAIYLIYQLKLDELKSSIIVNDDEIFLIKETVTFVLAN